MNLWNVAGAFERPKGVTSHSNSPYRVVNAVIHSSPFAIRILLKAAITSNLVNHRALLICCRVSRIRGSGQRSFRVIAFSARQSTQKRSPPPSFLINKTRAAACELLAQINPLSSSSVSIFQRTRSISLDMPYNGPDGTVGFWPSLSSKCISWSTPARNGGSLSASRRSKANRNS